MRSTITVSLALAAALALSACNTIGGAGKDVSSVGKAVTKTANDVKNLAITSARAVSRARRRSVNQMPKIDTS